MLVVVNIGEDQLDEADDAGRAGRDGVDALAVCLELEARARRRLEPEASAPSCSTASGSARASCRGVARAAYHLLGRRTFLTTGDKESRAWTFRAGAKAPECAGVIHSDLQRGFIRAEVIDWQELLEIGSWAKAKEQGKLRVEGKDYEVVDGDVLEIRFNV